MDHDSIGREIDEFSQFLFARFELTGLSIALGHIEYRANGSDHLSIRIPDHSRVNLDFEDFPRRRDELAHHSVG